jgi:glycogen debranching enzyme
MKKVVDKLITSAPVPMVPPSLALRKVTSKSGKGVYASTDTLFKGAIFGRDSLEVAEDILAYKPRLVKRIIVTLARLQGEIDTHSNEEEPGKIVHEYRSILVDGKYVKGTSRRIFEELSSKWGGDERTLIYYGSVDSTPHYLRLLGAYIEMYGDGILQQHVVNKSGKSVRIKDVAERALQWTLDKLANSKSGLLEYKKRSLNGIDNQVWKDSKEFYVHENKHMVNHNTPIASIEVQGLTYDALCASARFFPERAGKLTQIARKLRDRTIELLWQEERAYFSLGVDYDEHGKIRPITTVTSNPAELLDTHFFDELTEADRERYISGIIKMILGKEFLTDAGVRSRALSGAHLVPFWDYHGSYTTWPKDTYDIAKGMRRQGFPLLARQLENRVLNIVLKSRAYPEFVFVDEWGRVLVKSPAVHGHGEVVIIDSSNTPERIQAWTVSAVMAIVARRIRAKFRPEQ